MDIEFMEPQFQNYQSKLEQTLQAMQVKKKEIEEAFGPAYTDEIQHDISNLEQDLDNFKRAKTSFCDIVHLLCDEVLPAAKISFVARKPEFITDDIDSDMHITGSPVAVCMIYFNNAIACFGDDNKCEYIRPFIKVTLSEYEHTVSVFFGANAANDPEYPYSTFPQCRFENILVVNKSDVYMMSLSMYDEHPDIDEIELNETMVNKYCVSIRPMDYMMQSILKRLVALLCMVKSSSDERNISGNILKYKYRSLGKQDYPSRYGVW